MNQNNQEISLMLEPLKELLYYLIGKGISEQSAAFIVGRLTRSVFMQIIEEFSSELRESNTDFSNPDSLMSNVPEKLEELIQAKHSKSFQEHAQSIAQDMVTDFKAAE